jgi:hypothetical protein
MRFRNVLEDQHRGLRLLVRQLETRHSILSGFDVEHHLVMKGNYPAWSVGTNIYFNASMLPDASTPDGIVQVTGVGYHELAHVIYTPTLRYIRDIWYGSPMGAKLQDDKAYSAAFNTLEDNRIELLLLKRFRRFKPYMVAMFLNVVMQDATEESFANAYPLVRGRRYLSKKYRRMIRHKFAKQELVPDIARIVDAYCKLNLFVERDLKRAHALVEEYVVLMQNAGLMGKMQERHEQKGCHSGEMIFGFAPKPVDVKQIAAEVKNVAADVNAENAKDDEAKNGDSKSGAEKKDDGAFGDAGKGSQAPLPGEAGPNGEPSKGEGANGGQDGAQPVQDGNAAGGLSGVIAEMLADALADQVITEDTQSVQQKMRATSAVSSHVKRMDIWLGRVPETSIGIARKTANELQRMEVEQDPYWDRRVSSGRINVQRWISGERNPDELYDRWQEGGAAGNDQEWVILLDMSDSMKKFRAGVSEAAWVIKRAADLINAKATVIAYGKHDDYRLIYDGDERATMKRFPSLTTLGMTSPIMALLEADAVLRSSDRAIKGLLTMTDGEWNSVREVSVGRRAYRDDELVARMTKDGVVTCLTYYAVEGATQPVKQNHHGCKYYKPITAVADLPKVFRQLVASQMKEGAAR